MPVARERAPTGMERVVPAVLLKNLPTRTVRLQKKTPPQRVEFGKLLDENELRIESELKLAAFGG